MPPKERVQSIFSRDDPKFINERTVALEKYPNFTFPAPPLFPPSLSLLPPYCSLPLSAFHSLLSAPLASSLFPSPLPSQSLSSPSLLLHPVLLLVSSLFVARKSFIDVRGYIKALLRSDAITSKCGDLLDFLDPDHKVKTAPVHIIFINRLIFNSFTFRLCFYCYSLIFLLSTPSVLLKLYWYIYLFQSELQLNSSTSSIMNPSSPLSSHVTPITPLPSYPPNLFILHPESITLDGGDEYFLPEFFDHISESIRYLVHIDKQVFHNFQF